MRIRKGDEVMVIAGKDRGRKGKVRQSLPRENRVSVEGIGMVKRHMKPRGQARKAGIIEREAAVDVAKVMLVCPKCHMPARIGFQFLEDGSKIRVCKKCLEAIDS